MNSNSIGSQFKQIDYYSSVLSAYFEATPAKVWKEAKTFQELLNTSSIFFIIAILIIIFLTGSTANWSLIGAGVVFYALLYRLMKKTSKQFITQHSFQHNGFFEVNKTYWSGERFILFASTLNAIENIQHTEWKTIESLIDNEIELKKFELLKEPFFLFMIPIIGFLFKELFSRASDLWFTLIFIGIVLMILFGAQLILAFRNRENKMKELKLFVHWYQELGQDIKE